MRWLILLMSTVSFCSWGSDPLLDLDFLENFALAEDRAALLDQLVPGSDEAHYYQCLLLQQQGRLVEASAVLERWQAARKYPDSHQLLKDMKLRQLFLSYEVDPATALPALSRELKLSFNHAISLPENRPGFPTRLEAKDVRWASLKERLKNSNNWPKLTPAGFERLWQENLPKELWTRLLDKCETPHQPDLARRVIWDLSVNGASSFGNRTIHRKMTRRQLADCLKAVPQLSQSSIFVSAWVRALRNPSFELEDGEFLTEASELNDGVFLAQAWSFLADLPSVHNHLKATVLYNYLDWEQKRGIYNKERFIAYLKLPRNIQYMNRHYLTGFKGQLINLKWRPSSDLGLSPIFGDQELVWDFLGHFLSGKPNFNEFLAYVREPELRRLFVAENLMAGTGDPSKLAAMLDKEPEFLERLKQRVVLDLLSTNKDEFSPEEEVRLGVNVKNVNTLLVKIYEINTASYYRTKNQGIDLDIDLDGLVPGSQRKLTYQQGPLLRHQESFAFPELKGRGVYVVEFIGNGISSRALVHKGGFRTVVAPSRWGTSFTVFNEQNQLVKGARLHYGGHVFEAEPEGPILVPYGSKELIENAVIVHKNFASRVTFMNRPELIQFLAGFLVDREALVSGNEAQILIRPSCWINGYAVPLSELKDPVLQIEHKDGDGLVSTEVVTNFDLHEDQDVSYSFRVPENTLQLTFSLRARIRIHRTESWRDLEAKRTFTINSNNLKRLPDGFHLSRNRDGYVVYRLGKNGEPIADSPVLVELSHLYFKDAIKHTLQTDERGRIELGKLEKYHALKLTSIDKSKPPLKREWRLNKTYNQLPMTIHAVAGSEIRITCPSQNTRAADMHLLAWNRVGYTHNHSDKPRLENGQVVIKGLGPGLYRLHFKEVDDYTDLVLAEGDAHDGFIFSKKVILEQVDTDPLHISSALLKGDNLVIHLRGVGPKTRVHVTGALFESDWQAEEGMEINSRPPMVQYAGLARSLYTSGNEIGDEYRYILERAEGRHYPGNMLPKPGLLLTPWKRAATRRDDRSAKDGDSFAYESMKDVLGEELVVTSGDMIPPDDDTSLDFLVGSAKTLANLKPDKAGRIVVPLAKLGHVSRIQVVALDDQVCISRQVYLAEAQPAVRDLRLLPGLDPARRYNGQKRSTALARGETLAVPEANLVKVAVFDQLDQVIDLFRGLNPAAWNNEFDFIRDWPSLAEAERLKKYSAIACHELNFFLFMKDRAFFDKNIATWLSHKKDKTFLDRWLLQEDLSAYTETWAHDRLNVVERILLGLRLPSEKQAQQQHIQDLFALLPRDFQGADKLFRAALVADALEADDWEIGIPEAPAGRSGIIPMPNRAQSDPEPVLEQMMVPSDGSAREWSIPTETPMEKVQKRRAKKTKSSSPLFRMPQLTRELAENNYYKLSPGGQGPDLVEVNAFWVDFSQHGKLNDFRSSHFTEATANFTELMLALAVLDLPFKAGKHEVKREGGTWSIQAASPLLLFHEEIRVSEKAPGSSSILMTQGLFKVGDRFRHESGKPVEKLIDGELLSQTIYGCKVVLTNPTTLDQELEVLIQLPAGAISLANGPTTRSFPVRLGSYMTQAIEYFFYFPKTGRFTHYPATTSARDKILAQAASRLLTVVHSPSFADTESWDYLAGRGTSKQVLDYLASHNVARMNLDLINWRLKQRDFYEALMAQLVTRRHYNSTVWSYAFQHDDPSAMRTWLRHQNELIQRVGPYLSSCLVSTDPVARGSYEHLEYAPLINPRSHRLSKELTIPDVRLGAQYRAFLEILGHKTTLDSADYLATTYYLLLQDRVDLALSVFAKVKRADLTTGLQYEYLQAYLCFYQGDLTRARSLAAPHQKHPLIPWRNRFAEVIAQLDEIEGGQVRAKDGHGANQAQLAGTEPSLELSVEGQTISLHYRNLTEAKLRYYLMDIELLFSQQPFLSKTGQDRFTVIKPNRTETIALAADSDTRQIQLPDALANSNVFVEVEAGPTRSAAVAMANSMNLHVGESYGQLQVIARASGKPMPGAYVKVYARLKHGRTVFYKDGYTDLRGRFDYVSLSSDLIDEVDRFALLILSEDRGALVREVDPPKR